MAASNTVGVVLTIGGVLVAVAAVKTLRGAGKASASSTAGPAPQTGAHAPFGAGTDQGKLVSAALAAAGAPLDWLDGMMQVIAQESGGNAAIVNQEAVNGENATGLFQFLPSTFAGTRRQHGLPPGNILDPWDSALTAVYYIRDKYGSPSGIPNLYLARCTYRGQSGCYAGY